MKIELSPKELSTFNSLLKLGISEEEAYEAISDDRKIDKGEKLFELSPELAEGAKKARRADRKPNSKPTHRERKPDEDKRTLIQMFDNVLKENPEISQIKNVNIEREITFNFNNRKYRLTLACPRS